MTQKNQKEHFIIAIDGTSSSGKSSTAKKVAQELNLAYLDTGAMYRAVTHLCQQKGIRFSDEQAVAELARSINFELDENSNLVINGNKAGNDLRSSRVNQEVSDYCSIPEVRKILVQHQQNLGNLKPSVVEGRDITTVVFKDAKFKYFFWASPEVRAERRVAELKSTGVEADYQEILDNLKSRDDKDSNRSHGPLTQTEEAEFIDTTHMTLQEQTDLIIQQVSEDVSTRN